MIKIGSISLKIPFYLAPLSGYSDYPMRYISRKYGAPLTFTGVMLDKIALHPKAVRKLRFQPGPDEKPVGAQILGEQPQVMAAAAKTFASMGFDMIDLNFACPAPKVLRRFRGGFLMQKPSLVMETYRRVRDSVKCPVTMKIRIGYDGSEASREDFWRICEQADKEKVEMLCIHGRTVLQLYRGHADWSVMVEAKRRFPKLQIVGSGDVLTANCAMEKLGSSGVDGVLIARGAIGNPWIFSELEALYNGRELPGNPSIEEQGEVISKHFQLLMEIFPPKKSVSFFRKFAVHYTKRHRHRKLVSADFMAAKEPGHIAGIIEKWYSSSV